MFASFFRYVGPRAADRVKEQRCVNWGISPCQKTSLNFTCGC